MKLKTDAWLCALGVCVCFLHCIRLKKESTENTEKYTAQIE